MQVSDVKYLMTAVYAVYVIYISMFDVQRGTPDKLTQELTEKADRFVIFVIFHAHVKNHLVLYHHFSCESKHAGQSVALVKKMRVALYGDPFQSYGASLAIWDHTVLPATRHK